MAAMSPHLSNPKEIAEAGEQIFSERYKDQFEREHPEEFAAIDVTTGDAYLAETHEGALEKAEACSPYGIFHLIQVGHSTAFRVSQTSHDDVDWIFQ